MRLGGFENGLPLLRADKGLCEFPESYTQAHLGPTFVRDGGQRVKYGLLIRVGDFLIRLGVLVCKLQEAVSEVS